MNISGQVNQLHLIGCLYLLGNINKDHAARLRIELEAQLTSQQVEAARARAHAKIFKAAVYEFIRQVLFT